MARRTSKKVRDVGDPRLRGWRSGNYLQPPHDMNPPMAERLSVMGASVTLDGEPANIYAPRMRFATVRSGDKFIEVPWEDVAAAIERGDTDF